MATKAMFKALIKIHGAGSGEITTSKYAANRVNPLIARKLIEWGWATYDQGGRGNTRLIILTEQGKMEAELAEARSIANAE